MEITVNGEPRTLDNERLCIADLLVALQISQTRGVAVARNRSVVPKSRWSTEHVHDGDEIEIVRATQGG